MAMRSVLDKINLHHPECANGVILCDLPGTYRRVVVPHNLGCSYIEPLPGSDLAQKCSMVNADESNLRWPLISANVNRTFSGEMKQAESKLRHRFDQKDSRINGLAGEVSREHRICWRNESFSPESRRVQIDRSDPVHEQKWITMWNQTFNGVAPDVDIARRRGRLPEFQSRSRSYDGVESFKRHGELPEVSGSIRDRLRKSTADVCTRG
jgi:hypothetical protein